MNQTALAIGAYNRPAYFRPTIQSILCNPCVAQCDLWCFFDGGAASCQDEYRFILSQELSRTPYHPREVRLEDRHENWGCERNLIDLRRRLFDKEAYERVFVFEDDMIVGPHYLALSLRLLDWAEIHFSDIGAVQAYNVCRMSKEEKMRTLDQVEVGNPHWWGYLMPRRTWEAIRDTLYEYEDRYLSGGDYRLDQGRIRNWAVAKLRLALDAVTVPSDIFRGGRRFPQSWDFHQYFDGCFATGQDAITVLAMTLAGLQKLCTTVNRSQPIGACGLHSTVDFFKRSGLDQVELDIFASDATRESFRIKSERQRPAP